MSKITSQPTSPAIPEALAHARADFPILQRSVHGKPLVYLDNAASTQKPQVVIDAITRYYTNENANIHRGVHLLSTEATGAYEEARGKIARFINAADDSEIVFTRGATESVNLVAHSFVEPKIQPGDEILISAMEHHANIVPWQLLCERTGAKLKVIPVTDDCELDLADFDALLNERTKFFSIVYVSNAIGTVNDIKPLLAKAQAKGIPTLVDAAQAIQHMPLDVQELRCDFLVASGHKIYGPTGIGILYGQSNLLDTMIPYQGGGDMIAHVSFEGSTFKEPPSRFEAGTPHIEGAIGLGVAFDYLSTLGLEAIHEYESQLVEYAVAKLSQIDGLRIIGNPKVRSGAISFTMGDAHPHDIGTVLDTEGIAIRSGHHCCEPLMKRLGVPATARASFSVYNTPADVDALAAALKKTAILFM
ncbi:cysteine desulfurase [Pelagicoccus sp. SDUM812002]|uniref:cysteine desulfurase n=1 Tax=Pelagicoccus sp. SDUM812002 TaxID=3041266 RepID=UPI00280FD5F2|nr:cysteine desulfurase [Pelagicoccus sp. SDUM812002]MDQ8186132.1 cysteine desulfurase [Pelagicoccus sp. SDUM812002]